MKPTELKRYLKEFDALAATLRSDLILLSKRRKKFGVERIDPMCLNRPSPKWEAWKRVTSMVNLIILGETRGEGLARVSKELKETFGDDPWIGHMKMDKNWEDYMREVPEKIADSYKLTGREWSK